MTEDNRITFEVFGAPRPKGSMRSFRNKAGKQVCIPDNPKTAQWQRLIASVAQEHAPPELWQQCAVGLCVAVTFVRPVSIAPSRRRHPHVKPDLSKLVRTVEDALTGIIYHDDAQITVLQADKEYGSRNRIAVAVWRIDHEEDTERRIAASKRAKRRAAEHGEPEKRIAEEDLTHDDTGHKKSAC